MITIASSLLHLALVLDQGSPMAFLFLTLALGPRRRFRAASLRARTTSPPSWPGAPQSIIHLCMTMMPRAVMSIIVTPITGIAFIVMNKKKMMARWTREVMEIFLARPASASR